MVKRSILQHTMIAAALLLCVVCPEAVADEKADDSVKIPFSYFYGRWVDGHYIDAYLDWQNQPKEKYSYGEGSYSRWFRKASKSVKNLNNFDYYFTSGKYKLGVSDFEDYGFFYAKDQDTLQLPVGSFLVRARDNWQIGVDAITFSEISSEPSRSQGMITVVSPTSGWSGTLGASSHWLNRPAISIPSNKAAYFYFVNPIVGCGHVAIDNSVLVDYSKCESRHPSGSRAYNWDLTALSLSNRVRWGLSGDLEVDINANAYSWSHNRTAHDWQQYE
jgi:hypothetical protein